MEIIETSVVIISLVVGFALLAYLDKRFALGLNDSMSCNSLFGYQNDKQTETNQLKEKNREIAELRQRIETLEKIVTDPAEQLKQEIDRL